MNTAISPASGRTPHTEIRQRAVVVGTGFGGGVTALRLAEAGVPALVLERGLMDVTWGDNPPSTALNGIHQNIGMRRRLLEPSLTAHGTGRWLVRSGGGYRMAVDARRGGHARAGLELANL